MKKSIAIVLLLVLLTGCAGPAERMQEPVLFYYLRTQDVFGAADGVLAGEYREASGHSGDLEYLLALYLMGPTDETLSLPVPSGTRVLSVSEYGEEIVVELTETELTDVRFSLACACFTLTCLGLKDVQQVTLISGERSMTMTGEDIILLDNSITDTTEVSE